MKGNLRALGLCLLTIFALTAATATSAEAATKYTSEISNTFLFGESSDTVFTVTHSPTNTVISCKTTEFSGIAATPAETHWTFHPAYHVCKENGLFVSINVPATCNLTFKEPNASTEAPFDVVCSGTEKIKFEATGCTIEIGSQSALKTATLDNEGSGSTRDVKMTIKATGVTVSQSAGCPGGAGAFSTGDNTGTVTVKGFTTAGHTTQVGIFVDD